MNLANGYAVNLTDVSPKIDDRPADRRPLTTDRKGGNILKTNRVPLVPGCCGVQIELQCGLLLEGYRPGEVVRFFPASWEFVALPKEEQYFGRE